MKYNRIIAAIAAFSILSVSGCSDILDDFDPIETVPSDTTTSTTQAPSSTETQLQYSEASEIVEELVGELADAVRNNDRKEFNSYFTSDSPETDVNDYWSWMYERLNDSAKEFKIDTAVTVYTSDEIAFDQFLYWNYSDPKNVYDNENRCSSFCLLSLAKIDNAWKMNCAPVSDTLAQLRDDFYSRISKNAFGNGYVASNYQLLHNRSLLAGVNVDVFTAVLNDDGSVTLVLGIQSGYSYTCYAKLDRGIILFGENSNSKREYIDLMKGYISDYDLSNLKLEANSVTYVELTVPEELLINKIKDKNVFNSCEIESGFNTRHTPY